MFMISYNVGTDFCTLLICLCDFLRFTKKKTRKQDFFLALVDS